MELSLKQHVQRFNELSSSLLVHKRAASNIREQLNIIADVLHDQTQPTAIPLDASFNLQQVLESRLSFLDEATSLSQLRAYVNQAAIAGCLDSVYDAMWTFAAECQISHVREDIEMQRDIYDSDRKADGIGMKRILRDALRSSSIDADVGALTSKEFAALQNAIKIEAANVERASDMSQLYLGFLAKYSNETASPSSAPQKRRVEDLSSKVVRISAVPFSYGATTSVWSGELYGNRITIYASALKPKTNAHDITAVEKHIRWASFDHPNILPLLGVIKNFNTLGAALVAPFLPNMTIASFIRNQPNADRLKLITEIACALSYLHSLDPPYVHTFMTSDAVLVNEDKEAVLAGFASVALDDDWQKLLTNARWLAPEAILTKSRSRSTPASDVYSFAMTVLEIMTGNVPFSSDRIDANILQQIVQGRRPSRPDRRLIHHGLDDRLWNLMCRCWSQDKEQRPTMQQVHQELLKMRELPALNVRDLSDMIAVVQHGPNDIYACGAFGDIRMATLRDFGPVALKTLNVKGLSRPDLSLTKRFIREAMIWNKLKHPNVLPFLGTADIPGLTTSLVSPFVPNGNSISYLSTNKSVAPLHIAKGVARGLHYLHSQIPPVIHGDLRGANILVSSTGEPLLCDFGLAVIVEELTQLPISTAMEGQGNPRWMAPELLIGNSIVSTASDVYALGMVILELITLDVPFADLKNSALVVLRVYDGAIPERPTSHEAMQRGMSEQLWKLCMKCWTHGQSLRPVTREVLLELESENWTEHI